MQMSRRWLPWVSVFPFSLALALAWAGARLPLVGPAPVAFAASTTRYVATTGADALNDCSMVALPCQTVQHAADQSSAGDEIRIAGGSYAGVSARAGLTQLAYLSTTLFIRGGYTTKDGFAISDPVANPTILDAASGGRVLFISGVDASIANLTIQNGQSMTNGDSGGGIRASNALTLTNVEFLSNTVSFEGGGAYVAGDATLEGGIFRNNQSNNNGGGLFVKGVLSLTGTQFISNTTGSYGGGASTGGTATISDALFQYNSSMSNGGGLDVQGTLNMSDTQFLSNATRLFGGGAHVLFATSLSGGLFQNNLCTGQFSAGGGLMAEGMLSLTGTQFISNSAPGGGGGVYASSSAVMADGLFQNNMTTGYNGGGVYAFGPLTLQDMHFISNTSDGGGGGVFAGVVTLTGGIFEYNRAYAFGGGLLSGGSLALTGTRFLNNTVNKGGGGLSSDGQTTLNGGLFQNNSVNDIDGASLGGGGLIMEGALTMTDTQFLNNRDSSSGGGGGGGLYEYSGAARMVNVLFAANTASNGAGGALNVKSGSVQILHTTIASPTVDGGSAIYVTNGTVGITDTIIASHTIGISRTGGTVYEDYNLFFDTIALSGSITSGGHSLSGDPRFVDLANGDYHPALGSAAIDHGINAGVNIDLDGNPRPVGIGFDIGAYEYQSVEHRLFAPVIMR